jgi:GMP synthase-like glutamine amidotransferase
MKPVAIFRHTPGEGPGYFATFLDRHSIPWRLCAIDEGESVPSDPTSFGGLCFMGGPMSVNDPLAWIADELNLIRSSVARDIPVIGHCLGGQLIAKALGAEVLRNPVREIGWGAVRAEGAVAADWFGSVGSFDAFHWHGETFGIPRGASRILSNQWCQNQAFVLAKHLAMQCHLEMTAAMVRLWSREGAREIHAHPGPSVQSPEQMREHLESRIEALHAVADRVYARWIAGLAN